MDAKDAEQGRSFFFKRRASRKTHNQEIQAAENASASNSHLSAQVKSSTLPSNRQDRGACAIPSSSSGGLFSKLKRKLKIRSSRGKYDLKDVEPPRMRRKSDDPNVMKENRNDESSDMKVTSSVKTARRTHSDKEDVILIRKDKRVSVLCKTGDKEAEVIFSNMNSEDDESESFGDGGDEDPYATINSVKDEITEKLAGPGGKKKDDKSERDRVKARELLTKSMKEPFGPNGGILASPNENLEDLYAKIKKNDSKSEKLAEEMISGTPSDVAELNQLAEARTKSRFEPQYETLDDVRQRASVMCDGDYEALSHDSSVFEEEVSASIPVDPDYESLDDVKQRVEHSFSSSSSKADTPTTQRQSSSHYSKPLGSKSSKLSEASAQSTSASSFSTADRSPGEISRGSKECKLEPISPQEDSSTAQALPTEEKTADGGKKVPGRDANQQISKGPAPLATSTDSENENSSDSQSSECIYDNPNVILRKQMNRQSLSPVSPRSRSCNAASLKTPAEEELVGKLSSLLAPPLPLRNYLKDEVSRGAAGSCRHSWASPSPKFWDMSESWHGTDFTKGAGHLPDSSVDPKLGTAVKSKSQELFEGGKDAPKTPFGVASKKVEVDGSNSRHDVSESSRGEMNKVPPQCRIIPIIKSPGISVSHEEDIESTTQKANATSRESTPCRIIPITVSTEPVSIEREDTSSPRESSSSSNKKLEEEAVKINSQEIHKLSPQSPSALCSSRKEEKSDDPVNQQLKDCLSEAVESQLISDNVESLPEEVDSPLESTSSNSSHPPSTRASHSDEKMSSFISPSAMKLSDNEFPLSTEKSVPNGCASLEGKQSVHVCPKGKESEIAPENSHNLQICLSSTNGNAEDTSTPKESHQQTKISNNPPTSESLTCTDSQVLNSADTKASSLKPEKLANGVPDIPHGHDSFIGAVAESDSNEDINELDDEALMATSVQRNDREVSFKGLSKFQNDGGSKLLLTDNHNVTDNENAHSSQPVSTAYINLESGRINAQHDPQRKITQCLASNTPKDLPNGHPVPLHKGVPKVSQSSGPSSVSLPSSDVRRGSGSSLLTDSISSSASSSTNRHVQDGRPGVRQFLDFQEEEEEEEEDDDYGSDEDSESDPLGYLEEYDEMPAGAYQSDSSDDYGGGWYFGRRLRMPIHGFKRDEEADPPRRTPRGLPSDRDDSYDHFDLTSQEKFFQLYGFDLPVKGKYQFSSYVPRNFKNFPFHHPQHHISRILLSRPVLLENIINGHFCSHICVNPSYLFDSNFQWSRIFALPEKAMRRVEKKLYILFQRTKALISGDPESAKAVRANFHVESTYWTVTQFLKKIQDQPTFQDIRRHCLGTAELLQLNPSSYVHCQLPKILDQNMSMEDFCISGEEFKTSQETSTSSGQKRNSAKSGKFGKKNHGGRCEQTRLNAPHADGQEGTSRRRPCESKELAVNSLQLSPGVGGGSFSLLSDFMDLCDYHTAKFSGYQEDCASDEDDEEEVVNTYVEAVGLPYSELSTYPPESWAAILCFCRVFRGELAYTARLRSPGDGAGTAKRRLASWSCSGMDSHLSFSAWEEMDQLMKKLVPHISPRLDFQFLLRLYAEFKYFILKDRLRNKQRRGCFFICFGSGKRCSKKEEYVFLKLLRDELCYFSYVIRGCKATELLFLEEHSVAYSLTRLLSLVLDTLSSMNRCMGQSSAEGAEGAERADPPLDPTEAFSEYDDFDHYPERMMRNSQLKKRLSYHVANYKAFRTGSMWYDLPAWQQPTDFLDDPNLLQGNSSVFTHADNAIHVAQFGVYEDPKPLHEGEGFTESMQQLRTREWYWGPLSYEQAILVLKDHRDGTFLVRDSSDKKYLLSLSFTSLGEVHHTRMEHAKGLFSFWSQPESHTKGSICEFIDISVQNSKDGRFLYFMRPSTRGTPPIPIRLLHPLSRNFRVPSLKHLSRFAIRQSVRVDLIRQLPLPQKVKAYLLEKQYFVEILLDDSWAFEREGSAS